MTKISVISIVCTFFFGLASCFKTQQFPVEPLISNPEVVVYGDSAKVSFEFTDGDADLGLAPDDTLGLFAPDSIYYHNIKLEYFEKDDVLGWVPGLDLIGNHIVFSYRIKPIVVSENTEGIKGVIDVMVEPIYRNPLSSQSDTIKYKISLVDRALNQSNFLETEEVTSD